MKLKIYSIFLFALLLSCTQFNACKKDCDPNNPPTGQIVDFFPGDKTYLFPYKDFDTIKFIKNSTDTVLFLGGKIETGYDRVMDDNFDCPHSDKLQYMKLAFTNNIYGTISYVNSPITPNIIRVIT